MDFLGKSKNNGKIKYVKEKGKELQWNIQRGWYDSDTILRNMIGKRGRIERKYENVIDGKRKDASYILIITKPTNPNKLTNLNQLTTISNIKARTVEKR